MHLPVARRGVPTAQREHLHTGWCLGEQKQQHLSKEAFFLFTQTEGKPVVTTLLFCIALLVKPPLKTTLPFRPPHC